MGHQNYKFMQNHNLNILSNNLEELFDDEECDVNNDYDDNENEYMCQGLNSSRHNGTQGIIPNLKSEHENKFNTATS